MTTYQNEMEALEKNLLEKEGIQEAISTLQSPAEISGTQTPDCIYTFEEVAEAVERYLPNMTTALKLILAIATSGTRDNRVMLWLLLVGAPSSGKTDLVRLIKNDSSVLSLDNLTLNSFISGERETSKEKVYDLLKELNHKCLVIKDWTVIFSLDERMTKKIIGDMVGAYDKSLSKFSSRRGNISYNSQFSHLGCITPATLNKHHQYLNMIGPRFLSYAINEITRDEEEKSYDAIFANTDRTQIEKEVAQIVTSYLNQLHREDISIIRNLSSQSQEYLKVASRFMARARGIITMQASRFTSDSGEEISYYEPLEVQIEKPWRSVQQLMILSQYLALVAGKLEVDYEELAIVKEVVLSSMSADRAQALRAIASKPYGRVTAKELSDQADKSVKTSRRLLDELSFLKLIHKETGSGQIAATYTLVDEFKDFVLLDTREFMSHKDQENNLTSQSIV